MPGKLQVHKYRGRRKESSGQVNLLLSGFSQQNLVTTDQVIEAIEALPRSHIEQLQVIKYDPFRLVQLAMSWVNGSAASQNVYGAYYNTDTPGIVLYRFNTVEQFYRMLYHEIGHFVHFKMLSQALRDEWFHDIRPNCQQYVTRYAATNGAEDFAECYSFFCVHPGALAMIPEKMKFIAEKIFYLEPDSYHFEPPPEPKQKPNVPPAYPKLS